MKTRKQKKKRRKGTESADCNSAIMVIMVKGLNFISRILSEGVEKTWTMNKPT